MKEAISDLEMARALLRGNTFIDYKPLGLLIRLNRFQIMNNLAVANVKVDKMSDARALLLEALHDADDLQKKLINTSLERLDGGNVCMMQTMHVSCDRVFAPPKSVTQNIEKPGIVRKAKVVSAANAEDRNAAFEGSKRVRQLKLKPVSAEKTVNPLQRFVKKRTPRSPQSTAEVNGPQAFNGMKSSKSMSDLRADDNSVLPRSSSPFVKIKRLFQKRTSDSTDFPPSPKIRLNRSCGDLEAHLRPDVSNAVKSFPRSPFSGVRKLLNNKRKVCTQLSSSDEQIPVLVMRGSHSLENLDRLETSPHIRNSKERQIPNIKHNNSSYEKLNFSSKEHRNSLGTVFGNYLTIVNQTLTRSCDVLTAVVTPTEYENEVFTAESNQDFENESENKSLTKSSKTAHFYINSVDLADDITQTDFVTSDSIEKEEEVKTNPTARKSRPPPPSYPPPPLPPSVVIA
ncbi:uncharacterized protein LOC132726122 [Ruditapes philippinarum]|uniref:uncharacterized protein LOC132726122 n=1 Tax=Ruditapes philippinarum TaxID=129788 RepID=UPI00295B24C9|nr:uncharacterized protein LOC132726122 [Ruditapes philippinarum]